MPPPAARCGRRLLDHVCLGDRLAANSADVVRLAHTETPLSDHDASVVEVHLSPRA